MALHDFDAIERFDGANENAASDAGWFAGNVEHEVGAVIEEDVAMTGREIHGTNAWSGAAIMVPGGIAGRIGFGLDDASADAAFGQIVNDDFADEELRESDGVAGQFGAA